MALQKVVSPTREFLELEQQVMRRIIAWQTVVCPDIERQWSVSSFGTRELSGTGFFSHFVVPNDAPLIAPPSFEISVDALLQSGEGAGFTLFVRNGRLDWLEGYTYGDTPWPDRPAIGEWEEAPRD
ncbi:MAG TPA: hypothetical protein VH559_11340 [Gemmatimonadaceae bacterium]